MATTRAWASQVRDLVDALMNGSAEVLESTGMTFLGTRVDGDVLEVAMLMNELRAVVLRRTLLDRAEMAALFDPLLDSDIALEVVLEAVLRPPPEKLVLLRPGLYVYDGHG